MDLDTYSLGIIGISYHTRVFECNKFEFEILKFDVKMLPAPSSTGLPVRLFLIKSILVGVLNCMS